MIINNQQLSDQQLSDLDKLIDIAKKHDGGAPAVYKHLLVLSRDTPSNFLYYTPAIGTHPPQLMGFLSLYFFYQDSCEVGLLVHPEARHQGIAKQLLKEALSLCNIKKIKQLIFSTPPNHRTPLLDKMQATFHHSEYHLVRNSKTAEALSAAKLSIRHAKAADIPLLCKLDKACFETDDHDMQDRFQIVLSDPSYTLLVAELGTEMIGKLHLRFDNQEVELSDFCVFPAFQHQGLGSEFLSHAIKYLHDQNKHRIALDVEAKSAPILKLYTKHGFEITATIDFYLVSMDNNKIICQNNAS